MGVCRNQVWFIIFALFALWSLLLFVNYSSMILSVRSIANFYIYSVNQQDSIPLQTPSFDNETTTRDTTSDDDDKSGITSSLDDQAEIKVSTLVQSINMSKDVQKEDLDSSNFVSNSTNHPSNVDADISNDFAPSPLPVKKPKRKGKKRGKRKPIKPIIHETQDSSQIIQNSTNHETQIYSKSEPPPPPVTSRCNVEIKSDPESCAGRYIYVHILPRRYHVDLLRDCKSLDLWMDMCQYVKNSGLGPPLPDLDPDVFSESGWFATNQFLLEVIFHNRMKLYDCLTNDSAQASAIFVPFYSGLDVARHLWNSDSRVRDSSAFELIKWLKRKPEWKRFSGRDHFFIGGRITWDFRRSENRKDPDWGTKFLYLPEARNMTALVIESSPWNNNDFGIPYPTYFHPSNDEQVFEWQARMKNRNRKFLFSFAGAPRPDRPDSIRNQLIDQCKQSRRCNMLECNNWKNKCHKPAELMKVFQNSHFCLQPPGDSYTRRSTFDSILAGCIPVFFHPGSAYAQYYWHFPREYEKYSVFISMHDIRAGNVSVEGVLGKISKKKVEEIREEVVRLIPRVVYADPRCKLQTLNDAFDVAVDGVLARVKRIKEDMKVGRNESFGYDETQAWKYDWLGRLEEHEWDPYFSGGFDYQNGNFTNL